MSDEPSAVRSWHAVVASRDPALLDDLLADQVGSYVQGVDMLRRNGDGKLVSLTVMVRALRGLETLIELMGRQLAESLT